MRLLHFFAFVPLMVSVQVSAIAQSAAERDSILSGTETAWQNETGSTMSLKVAPDGSVSGTYVNRASGTGCQFSPYPIVGQANGNFIAFVVAWDNATSNCHSITAWSGYVSATRPVAQIATRWNIAYQGTSQPAIAQGEDTFTQVAKQMGSAFIDGDADRSLPTIRR